MNDQTDQIFRLALTLLTLTACCHTLTGCQHIQIAPNPIPVVDYSDDSDDSVNNDNQSQYRLIHKESTLA
ncbi:hypothetical protein [Psychrobacter sp. I-STPA10]|uniref:hypothetical protein n=1 Tax=Psychrobacter sp. I-STPA10 TaxID=2585769 RepID=UPI001E3A3456|nr:hypothetical protein [Psychrobacter sp. I-STPA10]